MLSQQRTLPEDPFDTRFRGLGSPVVKRPRGFFQTQFSRELIRSSIFSILSTRKGERVFLPEFGSNLYKMVFEPNDAVTHNLIRQIVIDDVSRWEKRVRVAGVRVTAADYELRVYVQYQIVNTSIVDATTISFSQKTYSATQG